MTRFVKCFRRFCLFVEEALEGGEGDCRGEHLRGATFCFEWSTYVMYPCGDRWQVFATALLPPCGSNAVWSDLESADGVSR